MLSQICEDGKQREKNAQNKIAQLTLENESLQKLVSGLQVENQRVMSYCMELEERFLQLDPGKVKFNVETPFQIDVP